MLQEVLSRRPSLMARLNAATVLVREDRAVLAGRVSWLDYRLYLVRMYGFHAAVEQALTAFRPLATVVADAGLRNHKAALLAHDLVALGLDRRELAAVPRMTLAVPAALPDALGWTYVSESTTLQNKFLVQRLARQLPAEIQRASAYLRCYGDEATTRWRELGDALDTFSLGGAPAQAQRTVRPGALGRSAGPGGMADALANERACERVIDAARDGLLQLRGWLAPVSQPRSTQRHA